MKNVYPKEISYSGGIGSVQIWKIALIDSIINLSKDIVFKDIILNNNISILF